MEYRHRPLSPLSLNRRAALGSAGAMVAVLGLGSSFRRATAQDATPTDLANHPIVGAWLIMNPSDPPNASPAIFAADGTLTVAYVPTSYLQPERGVVLQGTAIGVWEPTGERSVHLTYVQALADLNGTYLGTFTLEAYPEVSDDGRSFLDDGTQVHFTFRDATNTIVQEAGGEGTEAVTPQVRALRMQVGNPGFPERTAVAATLAA